MRGGMKQRSSSVRPTRPLAQRGTSRTRSGDPLAVIFFLAKLALPLLALLLAYAFGNPETEPSELAARRNREAEQEIMANSATAAPAIEGRLAEWLSVRDGLLYLREPSDSIEPYSRHVLPAATPWRASCGELGLTVMVGAFRKDVIEVALDEPQCEALLTILGRAMLRLTGTNEQHSE
jgi:hypothetical protein